MGEEPAFLTAWQDDRPTEDLMPVSPSAASVQEALPPFEQRERSSEGTGASAAQGEGLSLDSGTVEESGREVTIEGQREVYVEEEALAEGEQGDQQEPQEEVEVADEPQATMGKQTKSIEDAREPNKTAA